MFLLDLLLLNIHQFPRSSLAISHEVCRLRLSWRLVYVFLSVDRRHICDICWFTVPKTPLRLLGLLCHFWLWIIIVNLLAFRWWLGCWTRSGVWHLDVESSDSQLNLYPRRKSWWFTPIFPCCDVVRLWVNQAAASHSLPAWKQNDEQQHGD